MIEAISREEFLHTVWDYRPGEHVLIVAPTGAGKSHLAYQLLRESMAQNPELSVVNFMPKPADPTTVEWAGQLGLKETPAWPPKKSFWNNSKPNGYVLWPPHPMNLPPEDRREAVGAVLRKGLDSQFKAGNAISFVDDAHSAATLMGLNSYIEEMLVNGRAGGAGIWLATQKPSGTVNSGSLSTFAYGNSTHFIASKDSDERNLRRLGEVGGIDPKFMEREIRSLRMFQINDHAVGEFLYVDRRGPYAIRVLPW